ncbi:MAG: GDP-mannose 4,6-dehydratase [Cytophagales bacterium]|nr:GDP-mannose 4,6-dehydratase [Cytophagales bacterium]
MSKHEDFFRSKRVLITGGLGFIGSNLALKLHRLGARIEIVDALIPEHGGSYYNILPVEEDIGVHVFRMEDNAEALAEIVSRQDCIFNLAGQSNHWDSMVYPRLDLAYNCSSHLALLEAVRRFNKPAKLVLTSTRQIYGKPVYLPVDENHPTRPADVNGIHKMASEHYHLLYHKVHGIKTAVLRLTNTFGPRMRVMDTRQTFLGYWMRCAVEGRKFEVWGGRQKRDFNYIDDVVEALLLSAADDRASGKVYNLGHHEHCSLLELAELFDTSFQAEYEVKEFPADQKSIDIGDYYSDYSLINKELGWSPKISLEEGLLRTFDFLELNIEQYSGIYAFEE